MPKTSFEKVKKQLEKVGNRASFKGQWNLIKPHLKGGLKVTFENVEKNADLKAEAVDLLVSLLAKPNDKNGIDRYKEIKKKYKLVGRKDLTKEIAEAGHFNDEHLTSFGGMTAGEISSSLSLLDELEGADDSSRESAVSSADKDRALKRYELIRGFVDDAIARIPKAKGKIEGFRDVLDTPSDQTEADLNKAIVNLEFVVDKAATMMEFDGGYVDLNTEVFPKFCERLASSNVAKLQELLLSLERGNKLPRGVNASAQKALCEIAVEAIGVEITTPGKLKVFKPKGATAVVLFGHGDIDDSFMPLKKKGGLSLGYYTEHGRTLLSSITMGLESAPTHTDDLGPDSANWHNYKLTPETKNMMDDDMAAINAATSGTAIAIITGATSTQDALAALSKFSAVRATHCRGAGAAVQDFGVQADEGLPLARRTLAESELLAEGRKWSDEYFCDFFPEDIKPDTLSVGDNIAGAAMRPPMIFKIEGITGTAPNRTYELKEVRG